MTQDIVKRVLFYANAIFCLVLLYGPILTLVVYSFNASQGTLAWEGFTLDWYRSIFVNEVVLDAIIRSLELALISATAATSLGVIMALGMRNLTQRNAGRFELLLMLPMLVPEIVTAVGLLMTFAKVYRPLLVFLGWENSPLFALVSGHLTFALAYVVVIVKARVHHLDPALDLAAENLGASKTQIFWYVTLPQLKPAIICAFLLVFTLSLDDFYLSHFLTFGGAGFATLPVYLFGLQARSALTPEMNAVASLMILVSISLVLLIVIIYGSKIKKEMLQHD